MQAHTSSSAVSLEIIRSVLQELESLGIWHAIGSDGHLQPETIVAAVRYNRTTGRNPVEEHHLITLSRHASDDYICGTEVITSHRDRNVAQDVLNGGFWKLRDDDRCMIGHLLRESVRKETYAFRREEANLHISNRHVRHRIFTRDGHCCLHCGTTDSLSVDHVVAVANGGSNEDDNLQTLCIRCNSIKGAKEQPSRQEHTKCS
jgi:hypothetical protein